MSVPKNSRRELMRRYLSAMDAYGPHLTLERLEPDLREFLLAEGIAVSNSDTPNPSGDVVTSPRDGSD